MIESAPHVRAATTTLNYRPKHRAIAHQISIFSAFLCEFLRASAVSFKV
jgi:hypothetical protein